ncbi:hypothetical protein LA52FAK_37080 [Desulforhopalus sp. 52FAK]
MLKCRQLLSDMREFGLHHKKVATKRTRKGEQRLKNCVKYDMGAGYRLVTVMNDSHLFVTHLGTHDETDQWFDRHKGDDFTPENSSYKWERVEIQEHENSSQSITGAGLSDADEYEAQLEAKLNESLLLSIFQGLNRNRQEVANENV